MSTLAKRRTVGMLAGEVDLSLSHNENLLYNTALWEISDIGIVRKYLRCPWKKRRHVRKTGWRLSGYLRLERFTSNAWPEDRTVNTAWKYWPFKSGKIPLDKIYDAPYCVSALNDISRNGVYSIEPRFGVERWPWRRSEWIVPTFCTLHNNFIGRS